MLDNFRIVADACRKTGRDFWYIPQVNGLRETDFTSENMLRYQAYAALCYGATVINWACYTGGWWCNNVLDKDGNKTEQYEKLKKINAELSKIGDVYMKYKNTATYLQGYENEPWAPDFPDVRPVKRLDTGAVKDLRADGGKLIIGQMVHRADKNKQALMILNASDPYDKNKQKVRVSFSSFMRDVKIYAGGEPAFIERKGDEYTFELDASRAVLITLE